jgi:hypothetical protein
MQLRMTPIFYGLIFISLIAVGALIFAWYVTPPNPDRIGYWLLILFLGLPFLGTLGLLALVRRELAMPRWVGVGLIAYAVVPWALMVLAAVRPSALVLDRLVFRFTGGFEGLQALLWMFMCLVMLGSLPGVRGGLRRLWRTISARHR